MNDSLGHYGDVLNDFLFRELNADVTKVVWLGDGRWLLADCEEPELFVVSIRRAELVAK